MFSKPFFPEGKPEGLFHNFRCLFVCFFLSRYYGQKSCLISLYYALHFAGGGVERNGTQASV